MFRYKILISSDYDGNTSATAAAGQTTEALWVILAQDKNSEFIYH